MPRCRRREASLQRGRHAAGDIVMAGKAVGDGIFSRVGWEVAARGGRLRDGVGAGPWLASGKSAILSPSACERRWLRRQMLASGKAAILSPSPACGRRWRAAPDEGASVASLFLLFLRRRKAKVKSSASLRSRALIRPPGTFSRKREKGWRLERRQSLALLVSGGEGLIPESPQSLALLPCTGEGLASGKSAILGLSPVCRRRAGPWGRAGTGPTRAAGRPAPAG
jgi:hypothetical protein